MRDDVEALTARVRAVLGRAYMATPNTRADVIAVITEAVVSAEDLLDAELVTAPQDTDTEGAES